jgi:hypothetical protein
MNQGVGQGHPPSGGGGRNLSGAKDMTGDNEKTGGGGGGGGGGAAETKPVRKRHNSKKERTSLDLNTANAQIGPRTPAPSAQSDLTPRLNAALPAFTPAGQAPLHGYAEVLKSTESKAGSLTASSASPTRYATTDITQASETLGFGSLPCDTDQGTFGDPASSQPGDRVSKSPRPNVQYLAEFRRLEEAKAKKATGQSTSQTETPSAIRDALLAAPPTTSFTEFIKQTNDIVLANSLTAQGAQARELSEIGSNTAFKANQDLFNAAGAFKRTRSPAFPVLQQDQPPALANSLANASASSASQSLVSPSIEPSGLTSGQVTFPVPSQSVLPPTAERSIPVPRRVTISTPATLPAQVQASYVTPPRGSLAYRNLRSISGPRRPLHTHSQSFSQPAPRLFSASRPPPQLQFVTPTRPSLNSSQSLTQDSPLDRPNDTEQQKKKITSVMSSFREVGDSYDSIEWLPNERQASYGESPEPLTVPPQPVASYTTVGSLKPATNQHFTAPNRIQRDGTGRRAPQANLQGRGHDSHFGGRNMNQQYNTAYGPSTNPQYGAMNYSQYGSVNQPQFGSSTQTPFGSMNQPQHDSSSQSRFGSLAQPQHGNMSQPQHGVLNQSQHGAPTNPQYGSTHQRQYGPMTQCGSENQTHYGSSSQSGFGSIHNLQNLSVTPSMALTDAEKNVLQANGLSEPSVGTSAPSMRSGNIPQNHRDMVQKIDPSLNPQAESFNLQGQLKENGSGQTTFNQNSLPKIEDMPNFSQYKNPVQQLAKGHPAEAAAPHTHHITMSTGAHIVQQSAMTGTSSYGQTVNGDNDQGNTGYENHDSGDFDHNYRFPPPGLVHPTQANPSGSGYGQQPVSAFGSYEQVTSSQQHHIRAGRPQPLTAGPPGQRQNASFVTTGMSSAQGNSQLSSVQIPPVLPVNSPWLPNSRNSMFTSVPTEHSRIKDTLSLEEVRQYYPNGFPKDMTGQYTRLPGAIDESRHGMTEEEIKTEKTNKWFHAGVRNLNKTANDHLADMEKRNYSLDHGLYPQPPGNRDEYGNPLTLKDMVAMSEPLTVKEIVAMPLPEVTAQLLAPVFGNTLNLADQRPGPNNLSMLSRFAPAPPWAIDNSEQGNQSFFGEDWGTAPRRVGRDARYQPHE